MSVVRLLLIVIAVASLPNLAWAQECTRRVGETIGGEITHTSIQAALNDPVFSGLTGGADKTLCIDKGVYYESLQPASGGSSESAPFTIRATTPADEGRVIVSGAAPIPGSWTLHDATNNIYRWTWSPESSWETSTNQGVEWFFYDYALNGNSQFVHGPRHVQRRELLIATTSEDPVGISEQYSQDELDDLYDGHVMLAVGSLTDLTSSNPDLPDSDPSYAASFGVYGRYFVQTVSTLASSNPNVSPPTFIYARFHNGANPNSSGVEPMIAVRRYGFLPGGMECGSDSSPGYFRLRGLVFRHFNNAEQQGAVCPGDKGSKLINVTVEFTNGLGVLTGNHDGPDAGSYNYSDQTGSDHTFIGVRASYNGQMGLGGECDDCLVQDSELSYNNWKGYNHDWEAGGAKMSFTEGMIFRRVHAIGNQGPGIWFDIGNLNNAIEGCRVDDNELAGIFLELYTMRTLVQHNVVSRTRRVPSSFNNEYNSGAVNSFDGVGIAIQVAPENYVHNNTIVNNEGNGIFVRDDTSPGRNDFGDDIAGPAPFPTSDAWPGSDSYFSNNIVAENVTIEQQSSLPNGQPITEDGGSEFEINLGTYTDVASNEYSKNLYLRHVTSGGADADASDQQWYLLASRVTTEPTKSGDTISEWKSFAGAPDENYRTYPSGTQLATWRAMWDPIRWSTWDETFGLDDQGTSEDNTPPLPPGSPVDYHCYNNLGASPNAILLPEFLDDPAPDPVQDGCHPDNDDSIILQTGDTIGPGGDFEAADLKGKNVFVPPGATVSVTGTLTLIADGLDRTDVWISGRLIGTGTNPKVEVTAGTEFIIRPLGSYDVDGDLYIEDPVSCVVVELGGFVRIHENRDIIADNGGFIAVKGGSVVIGDNAVMVQKGSASAVIDPGSQFSLGSYAKVAFYTPVNLIGTAEEPILFVRDDPSQAWEYVSILGNGSQVKYTFFDGGLENLRIAAQSVIIDRVTSRNGGRNLSSGTAYNNGAYGTRSSMTITNSVFENASTVGVVLNNANGSVSNSDITTSDEEGVWMTNSTVNTFSGNDVTYNGSSTDAGIRMWSGTFLDMSSYALNRVQGNRKHEIQLSSSAILYMEYGYNSVCDAGDPGTTGKYVYDGTSNYPNGYENWWGTSSPSSSMFYGGFNYYPWAYDDYTGYGYCLSSANAPAPVSEEAPDYIVASINGSSAAPVLGSQSGSVAPLIVGTTRDGRGEGIARTERDPAAARQAIRDARAVLIEEAESREGPALLSKLHALQTYDRTDALGERAATEAVFETYRAAFGTGGPLHAVSERALLVGLYDAMAADQIEEAKAILARLDGPPISREALQQVAGARVSLFALEGRFDEALASLKANAEYLDADYVELMSEDLAAWAEIDALAATRSPQPSAALRSAEGAVATETFETALLAPYPNPSRQSATIPFTLAEDSEVTVRVYDLLGRSVLTVLDAERGTGRHVARIDGNGLAAGAYVVRMTVTTGGQTESFIQRITVVR